MKNYHISFPDFTRVISAKNQEEAVKQFLSDWNDAQNDPLQDWGEPIIKQFEFSMEKDTVESVRRIINYLDAEERRHWEELDKPETDHIFLDMERVATWLKSADPDNHANQKHTTIA